MVTGTIPGPSPRRVCSLIHELHIGGGDGSVRGRVRPSARTRVPRATGRYYRGRRRHGWASGDWSLTFHPLVPAVYGSFAPVTWIGTGLADRRTFAPIAVGTLAGSALYFVVGDLGPSHDVCEDLGRAGSLLRSRPSLLAEHRRGRRALRCDPLRVALVGSRDASPRSARRSRRGVTDRGRRELERSHVRNAGNGGRVRIVSLLPSATEMICGVGRGQDLVGVTHECDFRPACAGSPP